jgi:hypothetical protein
MIMSKKARNIREFLVRVALLAFIWLIWWWALDVPLDFKAAKLMGIAPNPRFCDQQRVADGVLLV